MTRATSLILRRLRVPALVLIGAYAVSVLGLVVIPGMDDQGRPWHMDFLHAFYVVSYMATTIGFGELPYPFLPGQRLWITGSMYLTVIAWLYAIGNILALVQNPVLKRAVRESQFTRARRGITERFHIVCGYGDTGSLLVEALARMRRRAVVIDPDPDRVDELSLENYPDYVPGLCADAADSASLVMAGLTSGRCAGVVALADDDAVNLKIAIAVKLLAPNVPVICRADAHDTEANMKSFGTDFIINPFDSFAAELAMALHSPATYLIHLWLTAVPGEPLAPFVEPPRGRWVICGYGRFGRAVHRYLSYEGVPAVVVDPDPANTADIEDAVVGRGTEAVTLRAARIQEAAGIVAGTDDDANNLSIIVTARDVNPALFTVARQNWRANQDLFQAAPIGIVVERAEVVAHKVLAVIIAPLLARFLRAARHHDNAWANELVSRLSGLLDEVVPDVWSLRVGARETPAILRSLRADEGVSLGDLVRDPRDREQLLPCMALLLMREGNVMELPPPETALQLGDEILLCGRSGVQRRMRWVLQSLSALRYVVTGRDVPDGLVFRWWAARRQRT